MTARPHPTDVRAVSYRRVSTEEQARDDRTSMEDQRVGIDALAAKLGVTVARTFDDAGVSGATADNRPGFVELVAYCRANPRAREAPGLVLVLNDSRWGRFENPDEATYWRVELERHGWRVRFAEADDVDDPLARGILRTVHQAQASAYREAIRANARRGARGAAAQGFWQNEAPLGYRRHAFRDGVPTRVLDIGERKASDEKVRLTPGPEEEQAVVKWMFEVYAGGAATLSDLVREVAERFSRAAVEPTHRTSGPAKPRVHGRRRLVPTPARQAGAPRHAGPRRLAVG